MASRNNEAKIRFTAQTQGFNTSIRQANNTLARLQAELRLNAEQMRTTGETADGLQKRHQILSAQLVAAQEKTEALRKKLEQAKNIFGENSEEVQKLQIQLMNAQTAEERIKQAINACNTAIQNQASQATDTRNALQKLTDEIEEQQQRLSRLKDEYRNAVLQSGENSAEAQRLARQINQLSGELQENRNRLQAASDSADGLDQSLNDVDNSADEATEGFTVMKGVMSELIADGITKLAEGFKNVAAESFNMANDITKATNDFIAKTGESTDSAIEFEDAMLNIYNNNFGENFEEISGAMATIKTALGDMGTDKLENLTEQAFVLRDTFDFEVSESVRGANSMMDKFGITADEAFNLIAQGAQNGLNQNGDLMDIVNEYSVQFAAAGYSAEDMFNMLANGVESGTWSVDKLGDAVKEFNIRMSDGSAKDAVEALGFSWESVSETWSKGGDDAKDVFNMLFNELDGLENTTEGYGIGVGLLGTMYEDLGHDAVLALSNTSGEIKANKSALEDINSIKYNDLGSAFEGIKRNLQTAVAEPMKNEVMPIVSEFVEDTDWAAVGQTIGNAFTTVAKAAVAVANGMQSAVKWMNENKAVMIAIASVIGVLTTAITAYNIVQGVKAAMDAANVTTVWALVAAHWAQATAAMAALAPYILIVAAIAAVIAIIVLCIKYWDEIVAAVKKAWEAIKETLSSWGEWINTNVIQPVAGFFKGLWEGIKNVAISTWDAIKSFFAAVPAWINNNVIQPVINFFKGLWEGLKAVWDGITNVISFAFQIIKAIITTYFQLITLPFRLIWENCKQYVFAAWEWIKEKVSTGINRVKTVVTVGLTFVKNVFTTVWTAIKTAFQAVWNAILTFIMPVVEKLKTTFSTAWANIKNTTTTIWNAIKAFITTALTAVKTTVTNIITAIKSAVTSGFEAVRTTATTIWNAVRQAITNVWSGIKSNVSGAVNNVKSTVSNVFSSIKNTATSVWNGIKSAITRPIEEAKNKVKAVVDAIKGFFSGLKLELPRIKTPHFSVSGSFSLNPPSVPKIGIEWYKDGGILTKPALFGMNGNNLMAGGEAGPEAILPIDKLEGYISDVVERSVNVVNLQALAESIEALANRPVELNINGRPFAAATAADTDNVNGLRSVFKSRGLAID